MNTSTTRAQRRRALVYSGILAIGLTSGGLLTGSGCAPHSYALAHGRLNTAERRLERMDPALKQRWPQKVVMIQEFINDGHKALRPPAVDTTAARLYAKLAHRQLDDFEKEPMVAGDGQYAPLLSPTKPAPLLPNPDAVPALREEPLPTESESGPPAAMPGALPDEVPTTPDGLTPEPSPAPLE